MKFSLSQQIKQQQKDTDVRKGLLVKRGNRGESGIIAARVCYLCEIIKSNSIKIIYSFDSFPTAKRHHFEKKSEKLFIVFRPTYILRIQHKTHI